MQLPVDVKALLDEMTDISKARETPLSVSVYIADDAPADLVAHVRNVFASSLPTVRMTISYLDASFVPHPTDDVAVIAAGPSEAAGRAAAAIRAVGVPVMVATTAPDEVKAAAVRAGSAIPEGDVVAPVATSEAPVALDDEAAAALDERMGRWIVSVCRDKRLAFAVAFPFMRRPLARDAVQTTAIQNAGVGLVPLIPGADLPIMTLNQAKMALQIAAAYGQAMDKNRVKELGIVVAGAYVSRTMARKLVAAVPVLGFLFKTAIAYGSTTAVGYAIIEYFEGGEDVTGVANVVERAAELGAKAAATVQDKTGKLAPLLANAQS